MLPVYRKCFVCSIEIKKANILSPQESSFMSCVILGIPNWTDDLQRIKFETVCYCQECLNKILKIRDMLEELQKMEKDILQKKYQIKSQLIESCTELERNFIIGKDGQQGPGMLQTLRKEIVTQLGRSSAQSMVRKSPKEVVDLETDEFPEVDFSLSYKTPQVPSFKEKQSLRSATRKIKEFKKDLKYGIREKTLDDGSLLKNNTKRHGKSNTVAGSKNITTSTSHNSKEVSKNSEKRVLKKGKSCKSKVGNSACPKPAKVTLKRLFVKSHRPPWKTPKKCEECGVTLSSPNSWKEHMMFAHGAEPRFKCTLCSYGSGHARHVARHMITHSKEKNFKCDSCSKNLRDKVALDRHMKIHGGNFNCKVCLCKFNYSSSLVRHETEAHRVDKNFKCDVCFKIFKAYKYLHKHKSIHGGKFQCKVCLVTFNHQLTLRRHEIQAHEVVQQDV